MDLRPDVEVPTMDFTGDYCRAIDEQARRSFEGGETLTACLEYQQRHGYELARRLSVGWLN